MPSVAKSPFGKLRSDTMKYAKTPKIAQNSDKLRGAPLQKPKISENLRGHVA